MLNLAHVMTAEDRVAGMKAAQREGLSISTHSVFCTGSAFVRLMTANHFALCSDHLG
jgi:hypothetical protein